MLEPCSTSNLDADEVGLGLDSPTCTSTPDDPILCPPNTVCNSSVESCELVYEYDDTCAELVSLERPVTPSPRPRSRTSASSLDSADSDDEAQEHLMWRYNAITGSISVLFEGNSSSHGDEPHVCQQGDSKRKNIELDHQVNGHDRLTGASQRQSGSTTMTRPTSFVLFPERTESDTESNTSNDRADHHVHQQVEDSDERVNTVGESIDSQDIDPCNSKSNLNRPRSMSPPFNIEVQQVIKRLDYLDRLETLHLILLCGVICILLAIFGVLSFHAV